MSPLNVRDPPGLMLHRARSRSTPMRRSAVTWGSLVRPARRVPGRWCPGRGTGVMSGRRAAAGRSSCPGCGAGGAGRATRRRLVVRQELRRHRPQGRLARPSMRRRSAPASLIMSTPRSAIIAIPRSSPSCCAGSMTGGPELTVSEPCSPAPHPLPRSSPHSPARRCPATSRAADAGPGPGSGRRAVGGSEEEQYRILRLHLEHWQPRRWCCAGSSSASGRRSPGSVQPSVRPSRATISPRDIDSPGRRHGCADSGAFGPACPRASPV